MSVKFVRPEVVKLRKLYKIIRDVIAGPTAIKEAGQSYLPAPEPEKTGDYARVRYNQYLERAVFFDATARTFEGFIGQMFYRETQIELPPDLQVMLDDVDGQGKTLEQQAKETAGEVLALGRAGLFTDYTAKEGQNATRADQLSGRVRPTVTLYKPESIINWRWTMTDTAKFIGLIVLEEDYCEDDDGFEATMSTQYRELRMVPVGDTGAWQLRCVVWRIVDKQFVPLEPTWPKMGNGSSWPRIPFEFIGSTNNDPEPDKPPFEGMAHVNLAHYRNSADWEETIFMLGQPTPWASGITEDWLKLAWDNELRLGAREFIPLPAGGQMGLLQMAPNSLAREGMDQKEKQLVALGAKIAENKTTTTTATEENRDSVIENSTLSSVAKNTSAAYTAALTNALAYTNGSGKIVFELNTDFELTRMNPQDRQQLLLEWQGGGITWEEYRWNIKRGGIAYQDDEKAKEIIAGEMEDSIDLEAKRTAATQPPVDPNADPVVPAEV